MGTGIQKCTSLEQVLRAPACLRDERVRLLLTEARARKIVDLRRAAGPTVWAERVRSARNASV